RADIDEAAGRLAAILDEEQADILTIYDAHGNYGHPDHIQVHRVGVRAAELAGTPRVYEATVNRDRMRALFRAAVAAGRIEEPTTEGVDETMGLPAEELTTAVDVSAFLDTKKSALMAHASQITPDSFFVTMEP